MIVAKQVADLMTVLRGMIAFGMAWIGWTKGIEGFSMAAWLLMASWTSDILDGALARRSSVRTQTWVGEHDLEFDILVSLGLIVFLLHAGFIGPLGAGCYLLVWGLIFWRWGFHKPLGMLLQAPIYAWFIWNTISRELLAGWFLLGWIILAVLLTWPRFPEEVIPGFLESMGAFWGQVHNHNT